MKTQLIEAGGTVQKALKKLVEVGLVKKGKDNIYENKELVKGKET